MLNFIKARKEKRESERKARLLEEKQHIEMMIKTIMDSDKNLVGYTAHYTEDKFTGVNFTYIATMGNSQTGQSWSQRMEGATIGRVELEKRYDKVKNV